MLFSHEISRCVSLCKHIEIRRGVALCSLNKHVARITRIIKCENATHGFTWISISLSKRSLSSCFIYLFIFAVVLCVHIKMVVKCIIIGKIKASSLNKVVIYVQCFLDFRIADKQRKHTCQNELWWTMRKCIPVQKKKQRYRTHGNRALSIRKRWRSASNDWNWRWLSLFCSRALECFLFDFNWRCRWLVFAQKGQSNEDKVDASLLVRIHCIKSQFDSLQFCSYLCLCVRRQMNVYGTKRTCCKHIS